MEITIKNPARYYVGKNISTGIELTNEQQVKRIIEKLLLSKSIIAEEIQMNNTHKIL